LAFCQVLIRRKSSVAMKIQNRSAKLLLATLVLSAASGCSGITNLNKTAEPELDSSTANTGIFSDPDATPADDSPYAHSPRRQVGHGFSIEIFGLNSNRQGSNDKSQLEIDDPEYAEYLEWKRWQEFKAYQEWKAQQTEAESAS